MAAKKKRTVDEVYELVAEIRETMAGNAHYFSKIEKIDEHINGNGKAGILTRLALSDEREAKRDRREWFIYTLLITQLAGLVFMLVGS